MIAELGHIALIAAFVLSLVQSSLPLIGASPGDTALMTSGPAAAISTAVAVTMAFLALIWGFIRSDFHWL